jgi:hypothetical protein
MRRRKAVMLLLLAPAIGFAQSRPTLRVRITDSVTGLPLNGAQVTIPGIVWGGEVDSLGQRVVAPISPGVVELTVACPTRTHRGRVIETRRVEVTSRTDTTIRFRVAPRTCDEPAYSERVGIFRGSFYSAFEVSAFRPCPDSTVGLPAGLPHVFWAPPSAAVTADSTAWSQFSMLAPADSSGGGPVVESSWYVRWRGVLKGPGRYGHMGVSVYSLHVDSVLEVRKLGATRCPDE